MSCRKIWSRKDKVEEKTSETLNLTQVSLLNITVFLQAETEPPLIPREYSIWLRSGESCHLKMRLH